MKLLARRLRLPLAAVAVAFVAAACSAAPAPSLSTGPAATAPLPSVSSVPDPQAAADYSAAMCPIFDAIVAIDPRLADLRAAGTAGGDVSAHADELDAVSEELGGVINDLDELPAWEPGRSLEFALTSALHAIRVDLLAIARDVDGPNAAAEMAAIPYLASAAMDRAMAAAVAGGMVCGEGS